MTIDRDLWQRARPLFDEIVELDAESRRARLEAIGRREPAMRDTLDRLLQADSGAEEALRAFDFGSTSHGRPASPVDFDPLGIVGRPVSHFEVMSCVAAGGMGVVYKATDLTLGRIVAIKFPLPHQRMDDEAKERFIHEARSVAALDHPNLCTIYEFGESAHGLYLAMPFYQGETLKDRIARERVLLPRDAVSVARQIASGLVSAHAAGIVHRDLKPGNVMILPDGSVKILDFGIAKVRDVQLTRTGVALGTLAYMAPGQATGERAGAQADLWAIGVMLYEMLTGVLPFRGPNEMAVLHAIMHVDPEPPSRVNTAVPTALDKVVLGLLQKDPSRRYSSTEALLTDLDAAIAGGPVAYKPPVTKRPAVSAARRVVMSVAAAVVLAAGAWFGRQALHSERAQGTSSSAATPIDLSVGVLPFVDHEGNDATAYLASGIANQVVNLLGRERGLKVVALSAADSVQGRGLSQRDIAKRLGVTRLVDGTVRIVSDTFYLAVRLTQARDSLLLWTGDFKAPLARLLTLERPVADSLLRALESGGQLASSGPPPTMDSIAYDLYLQARYAWSQRTDSTLNAAIAHFQGALQRDPRFAAAYAGMADAYVNLSTFGWGSMKSRESLGRAELAAHRAIALDSSVAEAFASLGFVQMSRGDYPRAEVSLKKAIQLNPNWSWAHQRYALLLQMMGYFAESRDESARTLAIDPGSIPAMSHLGVTFAAENRLNESRDQLQRALDVAPNFPVTLQYLGEVQAALGNYPVAVTLLKRSLKISSAFPGAQGALAYVYGKTGRATDARRVMAASRAAAKDERSRVNYALSLAIIGQTDRAQTDSAFSMLRTAEWDIPTLIELRSDPLLQSFRSDPRYPQVLARLGLKH